MTSSRTRKTIPTRQRCPLRRSQTLFAASGRNEAMSKITNNTPKDTANDRIVIDEEHGLASCFGVLVAHRKTRAEKKHPSCSPSPRRHAWQATFFSFMRRSIKCKSHARCGSTILASGGFEGHPITHMTIQERHQTANAPPTCSTCSMVLPTVTNGR